MAIPRACGPFGRSVPLLYELQATVNIMDFRAILGTEGDPVL